MQAISLSLSLTHTHAPSTKHQSTRSHNQALFFLLKVLLCPPKDTHAQNLTAYLSYPHTLFFFSLSLSLSLLQTHTHTHFSAAISIPPTKKATFLCLLSSSSCCCFFSVGFGIKKIPTTLSGKADWSKFSPQNGFFKVKLEEKEKKLLHFILNPTKSPQNDIFGKDHFLQIL